MIIHMRHVISSFAFAKRIHAQIRRIHAQIRHISWNVRDVTGAARRGSFGGGDVHKPTSFTLHMSIMHVDVHGDFVSRDSTPSEPHGGIADAGRQQIAETIREKRRGPLRLKPSCLLVWRVCGAA